MSEHDIKFKKFVSVSLSNYSINLHKKRNRQLEKEIEFDDSIIIDEVVFDDYNFLENYVRVTDFNMMVKNDLLYEALVSMEQHHRDIVYLSLCEKWSDNEISKKLNMSRSSVQRLKKRLHAELLKKLTGGEIDD